MKDYVSFEIKPNLPVLGREYGKLIPKIKEEIAKFNQMDLAVKIQSGEIVYIDVEENQIPLSSENLLVTMQGKDGFAFAGEGEIGVVLDTTITEELREEGFLREVLSKVQNMRKDRGFEVLDRITLYVSDSKGEVEKVIRKFEDTIKHDTLADNVVYNDSRENYVETPINGETILLDVER